MEDTKVYKEDLIGLKYLNEAGKLFLKEVPGAHHLVFNDKWILEEFIPFLFDKQYDWQIWFIIITWI